MHLRTFKLLLRDPKINFQKMSTKPREKKVQTTAEYCLNSVRQFDRENFLCSVLLNNSARHCALTIRAFNIEIARIQDQVTDPKIGLMRFQFWEDAILSLFNKDKTAKIPNHPVMLELRNLTERQKLSKRYFQRLVSSRRELLIKPIFQTLDQLENYAEQSVSSTYYLILEGCGIQNIHADHVATHVGKAQGLANILRSVEHGIKQGHVLIPRDLLIKYNISEERIVRKQSTAQLKDAVFDIATKINQHLEMARKLKKNVPKEAIQIFLPATIVDLYLSRLRKNDFDIFASNLKKSSSLLPLKLWWNSKSLRY